MPVRSSPVRYGSLPFAEAIAFFRQKLDMPSERWADVWRDAHNRAFMVAGATKRDLLADLRGAVDKAISEGQSIGAFQKAFKEIVARHGWEHTGPASWRSRIIFETNLRQSYNAGREEQIQRIKHKRPYALYRHGDSEHPRDLHLKWNNLVLPVDHPWWETHSPSNGYGCKCKKFLLSEADLKRRGLVVGKAPDDGAYEWVDKATGELHKIPRGIDPGFDYRPQTPAELTKVVAKREAAKPALAERLSERIVDSAFSSVKGVTAQGLSDLLAKLPAPQREPLAAFLKAHPVKTLLIKQTEMGKGAAGLKVAPAIADYLGKDPYLVRSFYYSRRASRVNGFTATSWDHLVIKVKGGDTLKTVDMQAVQAAAADVLTDAYANRGPRQLLPRGASGEALRRHWSVSANVGDKLGESAQRISTWLHELGHQVHFWAGEPNLTGIGLITEYAGTNGKEMAAEAFAAWVLARESMLEHFPELAKRVEAMLAKATAATTKGGR
ncbi:F protein [Aeromonas dhakensis]|uniref:phage minor head protein n=1 Tax=Aeromonas dhakensis TaxID=196024 RepID=UPI001BCFA0D0|nr:phage minor head protein [Aeromonas dhakensis]MBS4715629.1 F protein [Aeromonas dhakensis]